MEGQSGFLSILPYKGPVSNKICQKYKKTQMPVNWLQKIAFGKYWSEIASSEAIGLEEDIGQPIA